MFALTVRASSRAYPKAASEWTLKSVGIRIREMVTLSSLSAHPFHVPKRNLCQSNVAAAFHVW